MPSPLPLNNNRWFGSFDNHEGRVSDSGINMQIQLLENQLRQGSIKAAIQLASYNECKSNDTHECKECDKIASYFIFAFQSLKRNNTSILLCNSTLLALVQQSIDIIKTHSDYGNDSAFSILLNELRELGKRIKDQSVLHDTFVPLPIPPTFEFQTQPVSVDRTNQIQDDFGRAIRISIYYFRASLYENIDVNQSIYYYRKCVSVLPTQFDFNQKNLQRSAILSLQRYEDLISSSNNTSGRASVILSSRTSSTVSITTSSVDSILSSSGSNMICANCGTEKLRMPVCSRCKSLSYCSIKCLKIHKPIHEAECQLQ